MDKVSIAMLVGSFLSLLNLIIIFMLGRATLAMDKLYDKIDGKDGLEHRLTALEARIRACKSCRESTGS